MTLRKDKLGKPEQQVTNLNR